MARLDNLTGATEYDELFAGIDPAALTGTVKVAGAYKRGTVLTGTPGDTLAPVSAAIAAGADVVVLADDTESTDTVGVVYKSGNFRQSALTTDGSYELTDADLLAMRQLGIFVQNI